MRSISNIRKKRGRGRPPVGATPIMVRMPPKELSSLDAWIAQQKDEPSRPEAIRRLVDEAFRRENGQSRPTRLAWQQILELEAQIATSEGGGEPTAAPAETPSASNFAARPNVRTAATETTPLVSGPDLRPVFAEDRMQERAAMAQAAVQKRLALVLGLLPAVIYSFEL